MRTAIVLVAALTVFASVALLAPAAVADTPQGTCTLSYPGTCTVSYEGVRVSCSGVGAVPDCKT